MMTIECQRCKTLVHHNIRQLNGCNCDPDSPTWCYIESTGTIRGNSSAAYVLLEHLDIQQYQKSNTTNNQHIQPGNG